MPEKTGTVTGFIKKRDGTIFGLNIDGDEYLYSWPDKREEPFEEGDVVVGCIVHVEYAPFTDKAGKEKQYISVLAVTGGLAAEFRDAIPVPATDPPDQAWGYREKDRLMCRESCAKSATAIFAASIQAGIYKTHPDVSAVTAYASALEKWCLEALD